MLILEAERVVLCSYLIDCSGLIAKPPFLLAIVLFSHMHVILLIIYIVFFFCTVEGAKQSA